MRSIILTLLYLGGSFCLIGQDNYATINHLIATDITYTSASDRTKNNAIIPFDLIGGLIMIDTEINKKAGAFIFDTGAPGILINKKEELIEGADGMLIGINGSMKMKSIVVETFQMGQLKKHNIEGMEFDMSNIERLKDCKIDGIIGVGAYKNEEVLINYKEKQIEILPRKYKQHSKSRERLSSTRFHMEDQLPMIKIEIGKKHYYFGVDTGAEVNVIDERCLKAIKKQKLESGNEGLFTSMDESTTTVILEELKINHETYDNTELLSIDLSHFNENNEIQLDGILGFPFLKKHLVSFDFRRSRLNFWKEK